MKSGKGKDSLGRSSSSGSSAGNAARTPPSDEEIYEAIRRDDLESGEVIELGPTVPGQESLFDRMRTRITHGEVLSRTFDEAAKKRCNIDSFTDDSTPTQVDEATFDADVKKIQSLTPEELDSFDSEVCFARGERRDDKSGGIYVCRDSGFGRDVFGIAYDALSGRWCMTNEFGLHAHCEQHLRMMLEYDSEVARDDLKTAIISGFIFTLPMLKTPVMTPGGWPYLDTELLKKGLEELWSWKTFIIVETDEVGPRKHRWGKNLFTPGVAEEAQKRFR